MSIIDDIEFNTKEFKIIKYNKIYYDLNILLDVSKYKLKLEFETIMKTPNKNFGIFIRNTDTIVWAGNYNKETNTFKFINGDYSKRYQTDFDYDFIDIFLDLKNGYNTENMT